VVKREESRRNGGNPIHWITDRVRRTIIPSYNLLFPRNRSNPLTYLGFLTFVTFGILGVSGVGLMVYYSPDFTNSYTSVAQINNSIPFGFDLRNIHYYAADFMVILALAHCFYLYFAGRYRFHNEVLWVTGILFGLLTVLDAYTGYVLIMNERAMSAANIGAGLLNSISPSLQLLFFGNSYSDLVLRVYTLHIAILPGIMILLVFVHFPRTIQIDVPAIAWVSGAIALVGGIWPVALGAAFVPNTPTPITVPEWYLAGIYAFLRTGLPVFVAGVFLPFLLLFLLTIVPFHDATVSSRSPLRKLVVGFGVAVIADTALVTIWGSRSANLTSPLANTAELLIDPVTFWTAFLLTGTLSMLATWFLYPRKRTAVSKTMLGVGYRLGLEDSILALAGITIAQAILLVGAYLVRAASPAVALMQVGAVVILFGVALRIYMNYNETVEVQLSIPTSSNLS
jgi:quinol-cytochrome oxidoreductase complex cytochrome b subunit